MPESKHAMPAKFDLNDPSIVGEFERAAATHKRASTRSKSTAMKALVKEGVLTKNGRLTAKYRSK
jgi:hypothetical protein